MFVTTSLLTTAPFPLIGVIFLDSDNKVSVSQHGVSLMGIADAIKYGVFALGASRYHYLTVSRPRDYIIVSSVRAAMRVSMTR